MTSVSNPIEDVTEPPSSFDAISSSILASINQIQRIVKTYFLFQLAFLALIVIEIGLLTLFFGVLKNSFMLAISLAGLCLTIFSFFIFRIYLQSKKPLHFQTLIEDYGTSCQTFINSEKDHLQNYVSLAKAYSELADQLQGKEYQLYRYTSWPALDAFIEKFSCWCYWKDFHFLKELLLKKAIEQTILLVKSSPTLLEAHVALANAYVMLSGLYIDPKKIIRHDLKWLPAEAMNEEMEQKFRLTAKKAIEEFKIIQEFSPQDPWVHLQLAYSYHDLQMPEEEIKEYEILLKLRPIDDEILYKLGSLYFKQGLNAKGLQIYDALRKVHSLKAEKLIKHYGAYEI